MNLPCPRCKADIKLRKISPPGDPIKAYPAIRPCPSCGASLLFDLPKWVVPALVLLTLAIVVLGVYLIDLWGYGDLLGDGRRRSGRSMILALPVVAAVYPIMIWVFRKNMRITDAGDSPQQ